MFQKSRLLFPKIGNGER